MTNLQVTVKWSGKKYDLPLNISEPPSTFKAQLFSLTGVEPERQKILIKGGMLKDDTDWKTLNIQNGHSFMMMGTPGEKALKEPVEKVKFIEDMSEGEANAVMKIPAGLQNLGNTCYMNSTLQCLRAIPELRNQLFKLDGSLGQDQNRNLTVALRDLFKLLESSGEGVPPLVFLQTLRLLFPQFAQQERGHFMQQDAEECFSSLVQVLDRNLTEREVSFVHKYLTGTLTTTMTCEEAPEETPVINQEPFLRLNCHISQQVNYLNQGLQEALIEKIEKNSETLGRNSVYSKKSLISRLPKYLTVSFVRFFWKAEQRIKAKIMRKVVFPADLDLYEFCTPELKEQMKPAREVLQNQIEMRETRAKQQKLDHLNSSEASNSKSTVSYGEFTKKSLEGKVPEILLNDEGANITAQYDLIAVLTHVGRSADSGHYMAWTKNLEKEDEWWKFDDDKVTPVKLEDILKLSGGGDWHMAYLLIYRAKELH